MNKLLEQAEKASDFYIRIMVVVVTVVTLMRWTIEPGNNEIVFSLFALLMVMAMIVSGVASFVRSREK